MALPPPPPQHGSHRALNAPIHPSFLRKQTWRVLLSKHEKCYWALSKFASQHKSKVKTCLSGTAVTGKKCIWLPLVGHNCLKWTWTFIANLPSIFDGYHQCSRNNKRPKQKFWWVWKCQSYVFGPLTVSIRIMKIFISRLRPLIRNTHPHL